MTSPKQIEKPVAIECRFAFHSKSKLDNSDIHFIKEVRHYEDGRIVPATRMVKDYKRKFYITKPGARVHKQKKEREKLSNLFEFESTETNLVQSVARALKQPWYKGTLRDLSNSPYLYGTDIDSTALIKQYYIDKNPDRNTRYSLAVFDVETDVLDNPKIKEIVMATISSKEKAYTAVQKKFVRNTPNAIAKIREIADEVIKDTLVTRKIDWEIEIVDTEIDCVKRTIAKAHEWKPDFLVAWNMLFDIERVIEACERANVSPESILNDPSVPEQYRYFNLKIGPAKRITASGVVMPFKPSQRWHTVTSPASFYWIDAMGAFRQIRTGSQEEPSYALDAILKKYANISKLKFDLCSDLSGLDWHKKMQKDHPFHYVVYNLYDCIGVEILDEKTVDLAVTIALFSGCSDFKRFNSQPKRKVDELYFDLLKDGYVIGSTGSEMLDEIDDMTLPLSGMIVMLPPHPIVDNGLKCIIENPNQSTNIRMGLADSDVSAAYPTNQVVANVSKETTVFELIEIEGVDRELMLMNTINFSAGHVNAMEFCNDILDMPNLHEMHTAFEKTLQTEEEYEMI
jgi:hypothetical protein